MRLEGEIALVTGSTAGIGREIARAFGAEGAKVAVTGRDRDRGDAIASEIVAAGGDAIFLAADLNEETACDELVTRVADHFGGLTVLVNNAVAGTAGRDGPVGEVATVDWDAIVRVNLTAAMWLCRAAIPHMRRGGHGSIVNVSSRQAERASAGFSAYIASKGGLNALTRAIAVDYAQHDIRCNTISPGYVLNDRRDADMTPERRHRMERMHLTRLGRASDIAHAAVYLASSEAAFLTGANLPLDGGSSIARGLVLG